MSHSDVLVLVICLTLDGNLAGQLVGHLSSQASLVGLVDAI